METMKKSTLINKNIINQCALAFHFFLQRMYSEKPPGPAHTSAKYNGSSSCTEKSFLMYLYLDVEYVSIHLYIIKSNQTLHTYIIFESNLKYT